MNSPPRPSVQRAPPSTPSKRSRFRPRTLNKTAKSHNCKRCLFGRPEREEVSQWLDVEMQKLKLEQQGRWNFDFSSMTPLPGDWKWERVNNSATSSAFTSSGPPSFPVLPLATQQHSAGRRNFPSQQPLPVDDADDLTKLDDLAKDDVLTEDVFEEPEISQLAKRMKLSNDENSNPVFSSFFMPASPVSRFGSPLFGRASLTRSSSESSDASTDGNAASMVDDAPVHAASVIPTPATPSKPSFQFSSSSLSTSLASPTKRLLFVQPSTPCRPTSDNIPSLPRRASLLHSQERGSFSTASSYLSKKTVTTASQKRLHDFFPVKRRSIDAAASVAAGTATNSSSSSTKSRKRINFE